MCDLTAVQVAALKGRLDMVHLLLKAGAVLDLPKRGRRVQATELAEGHIAVASLLRDWKDDESLVDLLGSTVAQPAQVPRVYEPKRRSPSGGARLSTGSSKS